MAKSGLLAVMQVFARWRGVMVLNYHRVVESHKVVFDRGLHSASPEAFQEQLRFCKRTADVIRVSDIPAVLNDPRGRYIAFTFDDGYRDNYDVAFPILQSERISAMFFIATGFIDQPRLSWWDEIAQMIRSSVHSKITLPRWLPSTLQIHGSEEEALRVLLRTYKRLPTAEAEELLQRIAQATGGCLGCINAEHLWMKWDMIREMQQAGMEVGAHTVTHPILARCSLDQQRDEIINSCARLQSELGVRPSCFSYPVGGQTSFTEYTRRCLKEAHITEAFSHYGGVNTRKTWDRYDIRRIPVENYHVKEWFRAIVTAPALVAR